MDRRLGGLFLCTKGLIFVGAQSLPRHSGVVRAFKQI